MKKNCTILPFKCLYFLFFLLTFTACSDDDNSYDDIVPVSVDLTRVPYEKLSDYNFFTGLLKDQQPALGVLPYLPISSLFTDYASKKRFVWMPSGTKATINGTNNVLELPVGAVLIKTFYYDNVQPSNNRRIIETRIMIRKETGWIFAEYVWNNEQTEAFLNMSGSTTNIEWVKNGENITINYRIPSGPECLTCHKLNDQPIPIGIKPQNLNSNYNYTSGSQNQLQKWIAQGYLNNNLPQNIQTVVNYSDESQQLELRVRSYLDINCAHCHREGSHCDYRPIRLAFSETSNPNNLGVCVPPQENIDNSLTNIVTPNNPRRSVMHFRMTSQDESVQMPLIGKSLIHTEAVTMIENWIATLQPCN
jgi:uncharacterized repeat protein (TIGR03806 family)